MSLRITPLPDGPFHATGVESLRYCGAELPISGEAWLCRCGDSAKAPFCDGSHRRVGFSDQRRREGEPEPRIWTGRRVETRFDPGLCMHVFLCKPLKELRAAEPEATDTDTAEEILRVASTCPSGALTARWLDEEGPTEQLQPALEAPIQIDIMEGGELRVRCAVEGLPLQPTQPADRITLCRCGLSDNKPFCDGRHRKKEAFR
jgi:CDGSH-type Zn-finger protein